MGEVAFTRHSIRPSEGDPADAEYKNLSVKGVEKSRERARIDVKALVEQSSAGAVIFFGGASNADRTKETAEIYGEELKGLFTGKNDVLVLTKKDIDALGAGGATKKINEVEKIIKANAGKKILIDYPLYLSELSLIDTGWDMKDGKRSPYAEALLANHEGKLTDKTLREWIDSEGVIKTKNGSITGPNPTKVAKDMVHAISRLEAFAKKFTGNRPLTLGLVGHSFYLDAMITYLAGKGEVSGKTFDEICGGKTIDTTEMTRIDLKQSGGSITYRGKPHSVDFKIAKEAQSLSYKPYERAKKPFGERRPARGIAERQSRERKGPRA